MCVCFEVGGSNSWEEHALLFQYVCAYFQDADCTLISSFFVWKNFWKEKCDWEKNKLKIGIKQVQTKIQFLVTKRGWTWKPVLFLKSLKVNFLAMLWFSITWNQFLKDPARETMEVHFSLVFYEKIWKTKNTVFGYKKWSKFGFDNIL